jgi:hypothetical protein
VTVAGVGFEHLEPLVHIKMVPLEMKRICHLTYSLRGARNWLENDSM